MKIRHVVSSFVLVLSTVAALAGDFTLNSLPDYEVEFDLRKASGKTFYDFMLSELKAPMMGKKSSVKNDELLRQGKAVSVQLNADNYNIHVNYIDDVLGGRSYGWSHGTVGDWSDKTILINVAEVAEGSDAELANFYRALVKLVGACDASGMKSLKGMGERVATNFLAIYAAEAYRASLGQEVGKNWDDALFETMMLAAFHAGQTKVTKYYMGTFTDRSFKQAPGVFNARGKPGLKPAPNTAKAAELIDYWQFSANPEKRNSGINGTRPDFEKMGTMITTFEKDKGNAELEAIEAIVRGKGKNVIKDVTQYFAQGKADASDASKLADLVAKFLVQVRQDAKVITKFVQAQD